MKVGDKVTFFGKHYRIWTINEDGYYPMTLKTASGKVIMNVSKENLRFVEAVTA